MKTLVMVFAALAVGYLTVSLCIFAAVLINLQRCETGFLEWLKSQTDCSGFIDEHPKFVCCWVAFLVSLCWPGVIIRR